MSGDTQSVGRTIGGGSCAKCGTSGLVAGHIVWNAPIRFKADGASQFRRGKPVRAFACEACGHVELAVDSS